MAALFGLSNPSLFCPAYLHQQNSTLIVFLIVTDGAAAAGLGCEKALREFVWSMLSGKDSVVSVAVFKLAVKQPLAALNQGFFVPMYFRFVLVSVLPRVTSAPAAFAALLGKAVRSCLQSSTGPLPPGCSARHV
jgi:hypothetical protein